MEYFSPNFTDVSINAMKKTMKKTKKLSSILREHFTASVSHQVFI